MSNNKFVKGNELYKLREPKTKINAAEMAQEYSNYAEWTMRYPIKKQEVVRIGNRFAKTKVNQCRPMTIQGFSNWLGINIKTFREYEAGNFDHIDPQLSSVATQVRGLVEAYQYDHAAAGLLAQNIVARMLGLADKRDIAAAPVIQVVDMAQAKNINKNQ